MEFLSSFQTKVTKDFEQTMVTLEYFPNGEKKALNQSAALGREQGQSNVSWAQSWVVQNIWWLIQKMEQIVFSMGCLLVLANPPSDGGMSKALFRSAVSKSQTAAQWTTHPGTNGAYSSVWQKSVAGARMWKWLASAKFMGEWYLASPIYGNLPSCREWIFMGTGSVRQVIGLKRALQETSTLANIAAVLHTGLETP